MIVARGEVEVIAFMARTMGGNHNNAMLIDRAVSGADYKLSLVLSDAHLSLKKGKPLSNTIPEGSQ